LLDLATSLIEKKSGSFDAASFHDRYVDALRDLIERKRKSKTGKVSLDTEERAPSRGSNVIDLMAALKKSLDKPANDTRPKPKPAAKKAPARKAPTTRKRA
jgi:DNA end-binding protein Ku